MSDRYAISGPEGEFEPGSNGTVLRNLLGIIDPGEMEIAESEALVRATIRLLSSDIAGHRFTADDVRFLHRTWLRTIYPWAGDYRSVNVSKDGFTFAVAQFVPDLMANFEQGPLSGYSPCDFAEISSVSEALAVTHCELILIHPFREGNGRCARLLSQAMALQAGYAGLDFSPMARDSSKGYIRAIQASLDRNYEPMAGIFVEILEGTTKRF